MLLQIVLTIVIVFILGLAFALTSLKLGRGDKRPGCGHGTCSTCNPANRDATCPSEASPDGTGPAGADHNPIDGVRDEMQPEYDRIAAEKDAETESREEWDVDTDVEIRPGDGETDPSR